MNQIQHLKVIIVYINNCRDETFDLHKKTPLTAKNLYSRVLENVGSKSCTIDGILLKI